MTHKYGRAGLLVAVGLLGGSFLVAAPVLAADPPADLVLDGVMTVHHVDGEDGPISGATITVSSYRDPNTPIQVLSATTDASGDASIAGVARPAEGAEPVLLDVRSDLEAGLVDENGCTQIASWFAERTAVPAAAAVDVMLDSTAKSVAVSCPEPTEVIPDGAVLAVTSKPRVTPPETDLAPAVAAASAPALGPVLAAVGVAIVLIVSTLPAGILGRRRDPR